MSEAVQLIREILEHGDLIGRNTADKTIIHMAVNDRLDKLLSFGLLT